jgi:hypothetical protein
MRFTLLLPVLPTVVLLAPSPAQPQSLPGAVSIHIAEAPVELGGEFHVRIHIDTAISGPLNQIEFQLECDPRSLRFDAWAPGEALSAYAAANGPPPCDAGLDEATGAHFYATMALGIPFSSAEYGTEWLVLRSHVSAPAPRTTALVGFAASEMFFEELNLAVEVTAPRPRPPSILRGDADRDSSCSLSDAIVILHHLFLGSALLSCPDAADADDDGKLRLTDAVVILRSLFLGAEPMPSACLPDATPDDLPACELPSC